MIDAIEFENFKVLRECRLPLGPCTVLVGANGSGKSTVLEGLEVMAGRRPLALDEHASMASRAGSGNVAIRGVWGGVNRGVVTVDRSTQQGEHRRGRTDDAGAIESADWPDYLRRIRVYSLEPPQIARPTGPHPKPELAADGAGLGGVLTHLQDTAPERFDDLNAELGRWLPEFDRVLFAYDNDGNRVFFLRTREGGHRIPASDLSHGTLLALAILTMAYLPEPPSLLAMEEPDRGIHPRLLRRVQDAICRLAYPGSADESRPPVQVLVTTHSPYFLDLFKDRPEEIVIADRVGDSVRFRRLSDVPEIDEILGGAPLGEVWYTGILGGVPTSP